MKKIFKALIWVVLALDIIAVAVGVILQSPKVEYSYKFIDGEIVKKSWLDTFAIGSYVYMAVAIVILIAALILIPRIRNIENSHRTRNIIVSIVLIPVSVVIILFSRTIVTGVHYNYEPEYYEFSQDEHRIVVCEESWQSGGWGTVYQVNADNTAYVIGEFITDDGYRNYGEYEIEWLDEGVNVRYRFDTESAYRGVVRAQWVE